MLSDPVFYALLALALLAWLAISLLHWRWRRRNLAQLREQLATEEKNHAP